LPKKAKKIYKKFQNKMLKKILFYKNLIYLEKRLFLWYGQNHIKKCRDKTLNAYFVIFWYNA